MNTNTSLNQYAAECHSANRKWWIDLATNTYPVRSEQDEVITKMAKIGLMHSELSEALEGERKNLMDDHLPHRKMAEVELTDALIRIFDYAGRYGYDLEGAYQDKMAYNAQRADHKLENRQAENGKKF